MELSFSKRIHLKCMKKIWFTKDLNLKCYELKFKTIWEAFLEQKKSSSNINDERLYSILSQKNKILDKYVKVVEEKENIYNYRRVLKNPQNSITLKRATNHQRNFSS